LSLFRQSIIQSTPTRLYPEISAQPRGSVRRASGLLPVDQPGVGRFAQHNGACGE